MTRLAKGATIRRDAGLYGYERALARQGLHPVAGVDEAGRGACAGPLVASAVVLDRSIAGLADSKLLSQRRREVCFDLIMERAVDVAVVIVQAAECDRMGLHVANIAALRRALARLTVRPGYVLTDGFPVDGLGVPGLAVWKGDRVAASIAAASVIAKVTRDRIMVQMHGDFPAYDFATHKGYCTAVHQDALRLHGPCDEHRKTYVNVRAAMEDR
ncbi:ribonuclease HII [Aeromicrobium sp.]|uniref:ribonuclease HII n=1 Tax=Aeromicrobium sp. TaxID=1871063 RepID=UPI00198878B7|nr:ribonuclease HII [Aeromicrobium sp.]MBC7633093.1 ribonuclease HII [Aeromicrobium sp.]